MATRRERVVLELEDAFTPGIIRAAAATELLDKRLNHLSGSAVQSSRATRDMDRTMAENNKTLGGSTREIDRYSGRLRLLVDLAAILGPALVPIGAVAIPAVTGLASSLGFAAAGAATALVAFQGLGDGLKALNKAHLEPTTANLEAADKALQQLGPDARAFAVHLSGLTDEWHALRDAAAAGLFPGLESALDSLLTRGPQAQRILESIGDTVGDMAAAGAESLASERWDGFFDFIEREAPRALASLGAAVGDVAHGMAELWQAFDPLNDDFLGWMVRATNQFDEWATSLSQTEGFAEFIDYVRQSGPIVADALGSVAMALVQIAEAAAPLGGPVLQAVGAIADLAGTLAGSPLGPPIMAAVTALSLFNRSLAVTQSLGKTAWVTNVRGAEGFAAKAGALAGPLGKAAAAAGGLAIASSGVADGMGLSNTMSLALMGTLAGPWGAAVGGAVGLFLDLTKGSDEFEVSVSDLSGTLDEQTGAVTDNTRAWVVNKLAAEGVLDAANALGLSLEDVTDATLGSQEALDRVNMGIEAAKAGFYDAEGRLQVGVDVLGDYAENTDLVTNAVGNTNEALRDAQEQNRLISAAMAETGGVAIHTKTQFELLAAAVNRANRMLSDRASMRDYEQALDDFVKSIEDNGKTLDINTQKGRDNQAALDDIANTALKVAENLDLADRKRYMKQARADFIDAAEQIGLTHEQAVKLANQLGLIGKIKAKPSVELRSDAALENLAKIKAALDAMDGRQAHVYVTTYHNDVRTGGGLVGRTFAGYTGAGGGFGFGPAGGLGGPKYGDPTKDPLQGMFAPLPSWLDKLNKAYEKQAKALEESTKALEDLQSSADSFASSVAGSFNTDVSGGSLADLFRGLSGDVSNIGAMQSVLQQLQAAGLDATGPRGGLFQMLASSGNLTLAQQLLASGGRNIEYLEYLFAQRAQMQQGFGMYASDQSYGQALREAETQRARDAAVAQATLDQINAGQRETKAEVAMLRAEMQGKAAQAIGRETGKAINSIVPIGGKR